MFISAVAVSIGENVLVNSLTEEISKANTGLSAKTVISAGPVALPSLSPSPTILESLRKAYSIAISHTNIFATVAICLAIPATLSMRWIRLKQGTQSIEEDSDERNLIYRMEDRSQSWNKSADVISVEAPSL